MSIIKRAKTNFGVVSKSAMSDKNISLKAKGLLAYLLCMPEDWNVYVSQLADVHKEGKGAIGAALNELIKHGYITRERKRDDNNKFKGYDYTVYDTKNPKAVNGKAVNGFSVNGKLATTKKDLTKKDNTKEDKKGVLPFSSISFDKAWCEWVQYKSEKRQRLTSTTIKKQLAMLEGLGEERAIACINNSIRAGWAGLFPPKETEVNWKVLNDTGL